VFKKNKERCDIISRHKGNKERTWFPPIKNVRLKIIQVEIRKEE
jgi:hypothetical protein